MAEETIIIRILADDQATAQIEGLAKTISSLKIPKIEMGGLNIKNFDKIKISETFTDPLQGFQKQMDQMDWEPIGDLSDYLNLAGLSQKDFNKYAEQNFLTNIKGVGLWDNLNQRVVNYGSAVKQAVLQNRRFQFGWLSIMFAGMALERAFKGIISSQMELYGITTLTTDMWTILMAPAMDTVSTYLYDFITAMMNLPEPIKTAIGWMVLFGYGLGKFMAFFGQLFLFLGGLKWLFPAAFGKIVSIIGGAGKAVGGLAASLGSIVAIIAIIVVVIIGMWLAWKENFMRMKEITDLTLIAIKNTFKAVFDILKGIIDVFVGIFTGDFEKAKQGVITILNGFKDFFWNLFLALFGIVSMIGIGIIKIFDNIGKFCYEAILWFYNKAKDLFWGLVNIAKQVWDAIKNIFAKPITQVISVITKSLGGGTKVKDAIITPRGMIYTHPNDYLIATKNPAGLGGKGNITISPTYNIYVSNKSEMEKLLKENNSKLVEEVKRMVAV